MQHKPFYQNQHQYWLWLFVLLSWHISSQAIEIANEKNSYNLNKETLWFEDKSQLMTIHDVIQPRSIDRFQRNNNSPFNLGFKDSNLWFYLELHYPKNNKTHASESNWFLSIDYPLLDNIEIYRFANNELQDSNTLGDALRFDERPIKQRAFIYPVSFSESDKIQLFIKVSSTSALKVPLHLYNDTSLSQQYSQNNTYYGLYFGVIIASFLYNFFKFIQRRERLFIYAIGYLAGFGFLHACLNGHAFQYLWPQLPELNNPFLIGFFSISCFFGLLLTKSFLSYNKQIIAFEITLNSTIYLSLLLAFISPYIDYQLAIEVMLMLTLAGCVTVAASCISNIRRGDRAAQLFLLSWAGIIPGIIVYGLMTANYIPVSALTEYSILIGSALQAVLLSLSLENRISESQKAQFQLISKAKDDLNKQLIQLDHKLSSVEKDNQLKDSFLATISRELRNPINGIEGSLSLLNTKILDQQQLNYINAANASTKKLTSLIDSILNFSEIESGLAKVKKDSFEVRPVFNHLAQSFRHQCQAKKIAFHWHIDKNVPNYIVSDSDQLNMVLTQLIDNAIKYTSHGTINVTLSLDNDQLLFSIKDTGQGINQSQLDTIFKEFQHIDADYIRHQSGLGIGLSICYRLSLLMNGHLKAESTLGEGSHFTLSIPLVVPETDLTEKQLNPSNATKDKVALIAEDNPVNQMVLKGMLEKMDCLVLTANDGQQALDILKQQPVDIILMDCQMPVMDGFKATLKIRQAGKAYSTTPIIAVTANAMAEDEKRCLDGGMNDYIKKPINRALLQQKMNFWLNQNY